jgi:hypothetical protein
VRLTYRPIGSDWPGERTVWAARQDGRFKSGSRYQGEGKWTPGRAVPWNETLLLLDRELSALGASEVVFQIDLTERDIRMDGLPRADARPADPAVIISFDSRFGPLRYLCDRFRDWHDNVRAIALGLEALRKVERYGITRRGEQYTGWKALPPRSQSHEEAERFLRRHAGDEPASLPLDKAYRLAARHLHPDAGGSREEWDELQRAKQVLGI